MHDAIKISVVIIGRNSEKDISGRIPLSERDNALVIEYIYVDSCSQDSSVSAAAEKGYRVIQLRENGAVSAAAGRHAGTLVASGDYLLFLDSDMELDCDGELCRIVKACEAMSQIGIVGAIGDMTDIQLDGSKRKRVTRNRHGTDAHGLGGMVLLKRDALLSCGNWNGSVFANEENELYARIRQKGYRVLYDSRLCCRHFCGRRDRFKELFFLYVPATKKSLRSFGACGMAMRAALSAGALREWVSVDPAPIVSFAAMTAGTIISCMFGVAIGILIPLLVFPVILTRHSLTFLAVCPALPIHLMAGFFRYKHKAVLYDEKIRSLTKKALMRN